MEFEVEAHGSIYDCNWVESNNFSNLKGKIRSSMGFIFDNQNRLCIVNFPHKKYWSLPGGKVEESDQNYLASLVREVDEEADLDIGGIRKIGFIRAISRSNPKNVYYGLRFFARIEKIRSQTTDPAEGLIPERKFIAPDKFDDYFHWGKNGRSQLKAALREL